MSVWSRCERRHQGNSEQMRETVHTCDIVVEDVIFLDSVIYYLLRTVVDDQDHPLEGKESAGRSEACSVGCVSYFASCDLFNLGDDD